MNDPSKPSPLPQAHPAADASAQSAPIAAIKNAASYVGVYPIGPVFAITITEVNGVLYGQHTNQMTRTLREIAPDRFAIAESKVPAEIEFERDAAGVVQALVFRHKDLEQRGPRRPLPQWPAEVALPAEVLREYVGTYPRAPGIDFVVTEEGGQLITHVVSQQNTQMPTAPKLPIFASARDEFFSKITDARFSFERDANGHVTGFVLHQRMRKLRG